MAEVGKSTSAQFSTEKVSDCKQKIKKLGFFSLENKVLCSAQSFSSTHTEYFIVLSSVSFFF